MDKRDYRYLTEKARGHAFLLLKFRQRSEKEIYSHLKKKKFDTEIITKTISFLKEKGFIDDSYFAREWIESRLRRSMGLRRIKEELRIKGIDSGIIAVEIGRIQADWPEEEVVARLAKERLNKIKCTDSEKIKRRIYTYLLRRGFSPQIVMDIISQLEVNPHK